VTPVPETGFELVIFDCDGVLVDSERIACEVFSTVLKEVCGLEFTLDQMFDHFVGNSQARCLSIITEMLGEAPPDELAHRYNLDINQALQDSVVAVNGIEQVLRQLEIPYCVASSGSHEKMRITLGKTGLIDYFNGNIFSTGDVNRGKPYPDIYLHAAESMGITHIDRCLVIEDSPVGVTGALAAGMTVFGYAELMPEYKLRAAGAHHIFDRMEKLPGLTGRNCRYF
jgi:HAD superfamily hydrolase (TIGR01509 family)